MKRPNKYNAKKVTYQGITFDSKRERDRWIVLCGMQKRGEIFDLERQVPVFLEGKNGPVMGGLGRGQMRLTVDFKYVDSDTGLTVYDDSKGFEAPDFKVKKHVLKAQGIEVILT